MNPWKVIVAVLLVLLFFVLTKPSLKFNFGNDSPTVASTSPPERFSSTVSSVPTEMSQTSVSVLQPGGL